jgi:hypothetical protein
VVPPGSSVVSMKSVFDRVSVREMLAAQKKREPRATRTPAQVRVMQHCFKTCQIIEVIQLFSEPPEFRAIFVGSAFGLALVQRLTQILCL